MEDSGIESDSRLEQGDPLDLISTMPPAPAPAPALQVFVSRAGEDRELAEWMAKKLREAGEAVKIQDSDILPGHNFINEINKAVEAADHVIALFYPHYFAKPYCAIELFGRRRLGPRVRAVTPDPRPAGRF